MDHTFKSDLHTLITASFPTPLGPLITMVTGFEGGTNGSELNLQPNVASRPLIDSVYNQQVQLITKKKRPDDKKLVLTSFSQQKTEDNLTLSSAQR